MRTAIAALGVCFCVACGGSNNGDDTTGATLSLDPQTSELLILNGVAATQQYTATIHYADGSTRDVTKDTLFGIDSTFGAFTGPTVSVIAAGKTSVFGAYKDITGIAELIARVKSTRVDPALPPNTPDVFGNGTEDPARAPTIVYPPADVIMPRNLGDFETHWIDSHGNDVFELSLKTEFADVRVYVRGGNGKPQAGPMPSFAAFTASEWGSAVGLEQTVGYQLRGIQLASPGVVGAAPQRLVALTHEAMDGGIYYWASANAAGGYGIFRHDMAKPGEPAEEFMTTSQLSGRCVACHVLSRDGSRMAVTFDGGDQKATMVDVATRAAQPDTQFWNFATFTPDGNQLLTVSKGVLTVRNSADQSVVATMPSAGYVTHPDLSRDGTRLVYVRPAAVSVDWRFGAGALFTRTYDPATHAFGPETSLVADGTNNYYPSWSPDGAFILFNRAPAGDSYDNPNASLFVVKADGSAPPVQLAIANAAGGGLTNSWGRWAPFEQSLGANSERLYWVTVSSKRDFGVRLVGAGQPQIWMTPFFPDRASRTVDPSAAAFRLPFQDITSNNHIAQWTERVIVTQ